MVLQRYQQPRRRLVAGAVAALALLLLLFGWGQTVMVLLLLLLPTLVFVAWVAKQQQLHGVTDGEMKQIALCFLAGVFPSSLLALVAQSILVPLWATLCFYDQRDALNEQLHAIWDTDATNSTATAFDALLAATSGSGSGSNAAAANASSSSLLSPSLPHAPRLADVLQQLDVERTFGFYLFLFAVAFSVAALVEESLKLWIVQSACCCGCCCGSKSSQTSTTRSSSSGGVCDPSRLLFQHARHANHAFVVFVAVVAGAMGFSFAENVAYAFSTATFGDQVLAAVLRGCVSTPLHGICGGLTGVCLATEVQLYRRRRRSATNATSATQTLEQVLSNWRTKCRILLPAIVVHGTFDLQLFLIATSVSDAVATAHPLAIGVVLPASGSLAILIGSFWVMRRRLHTMEQQMHTGRYIQVAVDLESGRRIGFSDDDSDDDSDDEVLSRSRPAATGGSSANAARKTRAVLNV